MTEEVDVRLMSGMSKKPSVAKGDWGHSTTESIILMTYCGDKVKEAGLYMLFWDRLVEGIRKKKVCVAC